jgi:hypothetical protein
MKISWFSAGVSSAVATKFCCESGDVDKIIYINVLDQHEDSMRFLNDCEKWFGKKIDILQSPLGSVENVILYTRWINGPHGASCSRILKKDVRLQWESENPGVHTYIWGMDYSKRELKRSLNREKACPYMNHFFSLIERKINKEQAHRILKKANIKRPIMYELGYSNNNCIGCVKGGAGYWNKIRIDFPEIFIKRAKLEKEIDASCLKKDFLENLNPEEGRKQKQILPDCDGFCQQSFDDFWDEQH